MEFLVCYTIIPPIERRFENMSILTAERFIHELQQHQNEAGNKNQKMFKDSGENTKCLGLNMRTVFQIAKQFTEMP
ncbi:hypothetical protein CHH59_07150 [Shouchella clausii]|nr:hypothetical protein CHH59_07150 [Shouchella clausii]